MKQQLALAATATIIGLLLAEGAARLFEINPGYGRRVPHVDAPVRTVDGIILWKDRDPRTRPEDIARVAAHDNAFTLLGLGDSIMYGAKLTKEQTYLEQTRRILADRAGRPVEVLNLAVQGYNTAQEDAVHRELGDRVAPDVVLLHYWSDDAKTYRVIGGYVVEAADMSSDGRLVVRALPLPPAINDFILIHSRLYQLLTRAVVIRDQRIHTTDWSSVAEPLAALNERVRRAGGRLVVLASPDLAGETVRPNAELPALRQLATEHGFEVIDLSRWLDGAPAAAIRIDGCHFNAEGHRRIAEHLAEYLLARDVPAVERGRLQARGRSR